MFPFVRILAKRNKLTFSMAGDVTVRQFVGVGDVELFRQRDPRCGLCEEAEEIVLCETYVLPLCVRFFELGKDLVITEEDLSGKLHRVYTTVTGQLAEATITVVDGRCDLAEV